MPDILERLAHTSPTESSHELYCRCLDAAEEISRLRAALKTHDAWLGQAHVLCSDIGVDHGHIENRLFEAIGKAQSVTERDELRQALTELLDELGERDRGDGNAPGHCHEIPGVWDSDNGKKAGKPCAWCALWAKAKALD